MKESSSQPRPQSMSVSDLHSQTGNWKLETGEGEHPWMETWNPSHPHLGNRRYQTVSTVIGMHWLDFAMEEPFFRLLIGATSLDSICKRSQSRAATLARVSMKIRGNPGSPSFQRQPLDVRSSRGIVCWRDVVPDISLAFGGKEE